MRLAPLALSVALASTVSAQSLENEIHAEVARYVAAINSGNAAGVAALYVNHAATSSAGDGEVHRGWERVARLLRDVYEQAGTIRMTSDSVTVFRLGSDAAIAVLRYQWVIGPTSPRRPTTSCMVTRITDGDGIVCDRIGRVRLIGMDTPELNQQPYGRQAAAALGDLIRVGSQVQLEPDVESHDRYGRALAYVWVGRTMANWKMVRDGWAVLLTYPPNVQYVEPLAQAERVAREEGRGLWATGGFDCRPADHRARRCD